MKWKLLSFIEDENAQSQEIRLQEAAKSITMYTNLNYENAYQQLKSLLVRKTDLSILVNGSKEEK